MARPEITFTAEELTQLYSSCDDSVALINGVIADTWAYNDYANLDQAGKNALVDRFVKGLETRMELDAVIADSTSKTPYINAIAAGKTYITNNS
jgi:archaellum component FlaF (FlaF/FlaG flagellin family)